MLAIGNESAEVFAGIMSKFEGDYVARYQFGGAAMHDPCTIAYLLDPSLFTLRRMRVDVDTNTGISFGRTVHDIWNWSGQPAERRGRDHRRRPEVLPVAPRLPRPPPLTLNHVLRLYCACGRSTAAGIGRERGGYVVAMSATSTGDHTSRGYERDTDYITDRITADPGREVAGGAGAVPADRGPGLSVGQPHADRPSTARSRAGAEPGPRRAHARRPQLDVRSRPGRGGSGARHPLPARRVRSPLPRLRQGGSRCRRSSTSRPGRS